MKALENVLAVLVLYNCRIEESETFLSLNESLIASEVFLDVLIYDNSPVRNYMEDTFAKGNMRVIYISDIHNSGVSRAYNVGKGLADEMGKKWLLLLDQDSVFPLNTVEIYMSQIKRGHLLSAPLLLSEIGYLSPCGYRFGMGWPLKNLQAGEMKLRNKSVLNSGLLIHLDVFKNAGEYNVNIPLDFSDHEWLTRVKRHYKTIYVMDMVCRHCLSAMETDVKKVLVRFRFYLRGAKEYQKMNTSLGLFFVVFLRTIKLSFRFKTLDFLRCYLNHYL